MDHSVIGQLYKADCLFRFVSKGDICVVEPDDIVLITNVEKDSRLFFSVTVYNISFLHAPLHGGSLPKERELAYGHFMKYFSRVKT